MRDSKAQKLEPLGWALHVGGAVCTLLIIVGFWFFYAIPLDAEKEAISREITGLTKLLAREMDVRSEHRILQEQLANYQHAIEALRQRIPDDPREAEFLRLVTQASARSELTISTYRRGEEGKQSAFSHLEIHIQAVGSFESICRFLYYLQEIPRAARVISLQVHGNRGDDGYPMSLVIRLYYGVDVETSAKGERHV